MFILKLFMKVFLLPVMLVLIVLQVFLRITAEVFSFAAGFLTLIIFEVRKRNADRQSQGT